MDAALLITRLLLAVVFAVAGTGKLLDLEGSRAALREFGMPERLAPAGGLALPAVELGVGAALLFPASARWGALGAIVLLLAFIAGISNALLHDRAPECHCFGQIHSAPAGPSALVRNSVLALLAAFVALRGPRPSIDDWLAGRSDEELLLLCLGLAIAASVGYWLNRRSRRRAAARSPGGAIWLGERSGLPIGSPAPSFELDGACGGRLGLDALRRRGRPILMVFSTTGCPGCSEMYPHLRHWQKVLAGQMTIAVVSVDDPAEARSLCEEHGIADVMVADADLLRRYRAPGTPAALVIGQSGEIIGGAALGRLMIEELVRLALARNARQGADGESSESSTGMLLGPG